MSKKKRAGQGGYRKIKNRYFLAFKQMPFLVDHEAVKKWVLSNAPFGYVLYLAKRVLVYNPETKEWHGVNYDEQEREESRATRWGRIVDRNLMNDSIDLMEPLIGGNFLSLEDSDRTPCFYWLKNHSSHTVNFLIKLALWNGYIVRFEGGYQGVGIS